MRLLPSTFFLKRGRSSGGSSFLGFVEAEAEAVGCEVNARGLTDLGAVEGRELLLLELGTLRVVRGWRGGCMVVVVEVAQ